MTAKTNLMAAAATLLLATPAFAGSMAAPTMSPEVYSPPAPNSYQHLGGLEATTWDGLYVGVTAGYAGQSGPDASGLGLGVHAGYNLDMGSIVAGAEVEYSPLGQELDNNQGDMEGSFSAKVKAGYDAGDFLPYATLGIKHASADLNGTSASGTGMTYGVGLDYRMTESIIVGGELSQAKFSDFDGSGNDLSQTAVNAKVSFKF